MASSDFFTASTGQDFETPSKGYSDLSDHADPYAGQSMSGSNTLTERPLFGAAGSESEGSEATINAAFDTGGQVSHVSTALGSEPGSSGHLVDTKIPSDEL